MSKITKGVNLSLGATDTIFLVETLLDDKRIKPNGQELGYIYCEHIDIVSEVDCKLFVFPESDDFETGTTIASFTPLHDYIYLKSGQTYSIDVNASSISAVTEFTLASWRFTMNCRFDYQDNI
jgi:hypothetical protein